MIYISASMIRDYLICPKKSYFRTYKPESAVVSVEQKAGILVHEILEKYFREPREIALANSEIEIELRDLGRLRPKILSCISNYYDLFGVMSVSEGKEEFEFKIQWQDDVCLVGKIDKIFGESIYDWKTSDVPVSNLRGDIQMLMYHLAYKKIFNKEPKGLFYVALSVPTIHSFTPMNSFVKDFEFEILPYVINGIKNNDIAPIGKFDKSRCFRCNYASSCGV